MGDFRFRAFRRLSWLMLLRLCVSAVFVPALLSSLLTLRPSSWHPWRFGRSFFALAIIVADRQNKVVGGARREGAAMGSAAVGVTEVRLAEVMAALSLATDLAMGQPLEQALCSCVLAVRLGEALGLDERELRDVYYQ